MAPGAEVLLRIDPYWFACAAQLTPEGDRELTRFHEDLERYRELADQGDTLAILEAMALCCERALPAPGWLAAAFAQRVRNFTAGGRTAPTSLDTVFRSPLLRPGLPRLTHKDRTAWSEGYELWRQVRRIAHQHRGLDTALAEVLAAGTWPHKSRHYRDLVNAVDARMVHLSSGRIESLADIWRKVCKQYREQRRLALIAQTGNRSTQHEDLATWTTGSQHAGRQRTDRAEDRADGS